MRSLALLIAMLAVTPAAEPLTLRLDPVLEGFSAPLQVVPVPGASSAALLVVERAGTLALITPAVGAKPRRVLDVTERVQTGTGYNEEGLLSVAFHPRWPADDRLVAWLSRERPKRMEVVQWRWPAGADQIDASAERVLLSRPWPHANHKGGCLRFGPDGFLYLSLGDGGGGGDPQGNGQDLNSLLGKIVRLDIDRQTADQPYAIPADNPFVNRRGAKPEIWAYGLRNVWRMAFDPADGRLWAADVGQNRIEEIDIIVKGGNYGWNRREGDQPFQNGAVQSGDVEPIHTYERQLGRSITGGAVYRGSAIPGLVGRYVFGDYQSGLVWSIALDGSDRQTHLSSTWALASIDPDGAGELWLSDLNGRIGRLGR